MRRVIQDKEGGSTELLQKLRVRLGKLRVRLRLRVRG